MRRKRPLTLTVKLCEARLKFAESHVKWKKKCRRELFADEKNLN